MMLSKSLAPRWLMGLLLSALFVACGPPPKPTELSRLESMRNDAYTAQIAQVAPQDLEKVEKLYREANDAWKNSDLERAREYAYLGQIQYRSAEARSRMKEEQTRLDSFLGELASVNQERELLNVKTEGVKKSIAQLQDTLGRLDQAASSAQKSTVEQAILAAEGERERARGVKAPDFAAGPFNLGENTIRLAQQQLEAGMLEDALKQANDAKASFSDAYNQAKPEFDKTQSSAQRAERELALFKAAQSSFPGNALQDSRGVVVVMPASFEKGKTTLLAGRYGEIDAIAQIAKDYPETSVIVQGYTQSKGSESTNLTVSQSRADGVRDLLIQKGVDAKRLTSAGYGVESPRYDNKSKSERANNDRVEVIFVMTGS